MGKIDKLITRLLSRPKDFTWDELVVLLSHFGYEEIKKGKTGGSRRRFADMYGNVIHLHKPHPANVLKLYALKEIIDHLKVKHNLNNE